MLLAKRKYKEWGFFGKKKKKDDFVLQLFGFGWENTGQIYLDPENDF